jgi:hypothetical protein
MARYRFHCTNGTECLFNANGAVLCVPASLANRAKQVAREVMRMLGDRVRLIGWRVAVCDLEGRRVLLQPFLPQVRKAQSANSTV